MSNAVRYPIEPHNVGRLRTQLRRRLPALDGRCPRATPADLTVIVPAFNEAESLADTIRSLQAQTTPPKEIIVVDDCSTDATADIARACGATVVQPPTNTGSKAGAQTFALKFVRTGLTMAVDA